MPLTRIKCRFYALYDSNSGAVILLSLAPIHLGVGRGFNVLEELARELPGRVHHDACVHLRDVLGLAELPLLEGLAERPTLLLVHLVAGLADQALHIRVDAARGDGQARDVRLLHSEMARDGVGGGLGAPVGAPRGVA